MVRRWAGWELKLTERTEEEDDRGCWALLRRRRARSEDRFELVRERAGRDGNGTLDVDAELIEWHKAGSEVVDAWEAIDEGVGRP